MKCPHCSKENREGLKFCVYCGSNMQEKPLENQRLYVDPSPKKKFKFDKKKSIVLAAILFFFALIACILLILKPFSNDDAFQDAIITGQRYLDQQDYEKAEDYFLEANSIEPKAVEPYEKLYQIYTETNQPEKVEVVQKNAQENLSSEDLNEFEEEIAEIQHSQGITQYTVISEDVPSFDETPVDNRDKGYVVRINGHYGFIDTNNDYVMDPKYEGLLLYLPAIGTFEEDNAFSVCMIPDVDNRSFNDGDSLEYVTGESDHPSCGEGWGGAQIGVITFDDYNGVYFYNYWEETYAEASTDRTILIYKNKSTNGFEEDKSQYYILPKATMKPVGPYTLEELPTFSFKSLYGSKPYEEAKENYLSVFVNIGNPYVLGLFYEKTEEGYKIWNEDGSQSYPELFDSAKPISNNAMQVTKDGKLGIIDKDLNLVLFGDFEDATLPIDGKAYVKIDGKWVQIQIDQ